MLISFVYIFAAYQQPFVLHGWWRWLIRGLVPPRLGCPGALSVAGYIILFVSVAGYKILFPIAKSLIRVRFTSTARIVNSLDIRVRFTSLTRIAYIPFLWHLGQVQRLQR